MKPWIKKIFGFGVASFFADFSHEMTIALIPVVVAQFSGAAQAPFILGMIASLGDAFAAFVRIFSGYLTDRISRKKNLIMLGYGLAAFCTTMVGFANSLWGVLSFRTLAFVGSGLREPPRDAVIATIIEPEHYGRAFGLRNAMDTVGSLVGPLVAFLCIGFLSMQEIFLLSFVPGMLAVAAILFLTQDVSIPKRGNTISPTFFQDLMSLPRPFMLFLLILFIFDLSNFNKLLLLARTQEILHADALSVAKWIVLLYALFNFVRACGELIIGFMSDYVNRIVLLALLGCGLFASTAFLLIAPHASLLSCALIFSLAGISTAASFTLKKACAADMLPPAIRGLGYGTLQASEGLAALISSALIGFLWTHYSPALGFSYAIIMSLIAMVLLLGFWVAQKL